MIFLNKIFIVALVAVSSKADDYYCDPDPCPPSPDAHPHVACGVDIDWFPNCQESELIEFDDEMKRIILDEHNKVRNQQAMGETPGFEPAKRMATMVWDDELAKLAKYNTVQCEMKHDKCRSTRFFWMAGQNLAIHGEMDNNEICRWVPGYWFSEYPRADMSDINQQDRLQDSNGDDLGHFTQVVKDDSYKVGCSISKYTEESGARKSLVACNYAVANIYSYPIYDAGATASECKSGINPQYPGLCSENEDYTDKMWFRPDF